MNAPNLKHASELLQQIAAGLNQLRLPARPPGLLAAGPSIGCIQVTFVSGEGRFEFSLAEALDAIANDIYWDERGDWADARLAIVEVI